MKKTFFKNLFRDIKKSISRFLSIVIIIAIGVAFYAGVRATSPDMKISADYYFNNNNFMDFKLISTLGITEDDIEAIEKLKGISKAEGSYSIDGVIEKNNHSIVVNINSLPDKNSMNRINITEGRTIKSDKEVIVEERFLKEYKLNIGDIIVIKSGNKSNIKDNLKNDSFKIVGTAQSPLYISAQRQISSVGDGDVKGFIYILPEVFKNDVYTEMYVRCNNKESRYSLLKNEEYKNIMTEMEKQLKYAGIERNKIRYIQVLKNAEDKIDEAENKLVISRKEVENKVLQGRSKIEEARDKLNQGKVEFEKNESDFNKKISDAEKQISQGKVNIKIAKENIDLKDREIENGNIEIKKAKDKISHSENKLMESKLQAENRILKQMKAKLEKAKNNKDSMPFNPLYIREYNSIYNIYKNIKGKDFDSIYTNLNDSGFIDIFNGYFDIKVLKANFDKAALDISKGKQQIFTREQLLKEGEIKLKKGKSDVEVNKKRLSALEVKLDKKKKDGIARLSKEKINIKDSEKAINENIEKLNAEELKANSQLKLAEIEIQNNREKLKHIKNPQWYVLGRAFNIGYESFRQDSDRIDNIGKAFPLIFFLVAALVSLTTMTRMVQEKRIEIGTFKALGYSRLAIVSHYLIYSSLASIIGSIIGISFGFRLFPPLIMNAYGSLYTIPHYLTPFNANLALKASLIAIIFTTLASIGAALSELREVPALLMRPKPPKAGKTILAEKMSFLWKRLSFTKKVTARNIFRYKQRFFMTVIGIAACTGLIITGFALKEGIIGAMYKQFNEIYKYDMQINLNDYVDSEKKKNIYNSIIKKTNIKSALFIYSKNASVKEAGAGSEDVYIIVPESKDELNRYINLSMDDSTLTLGDEGVVITEKLSKLINKKVGDNFKINIEGKVVEGKISSITEQYIQHYIYISPSYYKKITGENIEFNSMYGTLYNSSNSSQENTLRMLKTIDEVNSVSFKNNIKVSLNKSIDSINSVVLVLIISAGILAFVVIYNLTNININERKRELATIKLLGFYDNELALYIYRENIILTIIGASAGILYGIFISKLIISSAEINAMMFIKSINFIYCIYSFMITIVFSFIVNLIMYNRFAKIDMIESLKNPE